MFKMLRQSIMLVLFFSAAVFAQIPNGNFEQWSNGAPVGWWAVYNSLGASITQTSDAHQGSAAKGSVILFNTVAISPVLASGSNGGEGFTVSQKYTNLTGYYKMTSVGGDYLVITIAMWSSGQSVAAGSANLSAASSYTNFSIPITYIVDEVPDSCWINILITNDNSSGVNNGSEFYVDDLAMNTNPSAVNDKLQKLSYKLVQNYPNPFNPSTTINYEIPANENVKLVIYNSLGQHVKTLIDEYKNAGNYQAAWNGKDNNNVSVPSGIYFYRIQAGSFIQSRKMILLK